MSDPNFIAYEWKNGKLADCDPSFPTGFYAAEGGHRDFLATVRGLGQSTGFAKAWIPTNKP